MVGVAELESATPCVSCKCSNQLSYTPMCQGVDLNHRPKAYESSALPLSYPGLVVKVGYFLILNQICQAFFKKYIFCFYALSTFLISNALFFRTGKILNIAKSKFAFAKNMVGQPPIPPLLLFFTRRIEIL